MSLVWVLAGIAVLGGVAMVAAGRGRGLTRAEPDRPDVAIPTDRPLVQADVDALRFSVGLRGYRMDEVDDVLDRLATDLAARDARIAELEEPAPVDEPEPEDAAQEPEPAHGADGRPQPDPVVARTMIVPVEELPSSAAAPAAEDEPPDPVTGPAGPGDGG